MTDHLVQAYRQAPWRVQLQWIGIFLLALVGVALVASVYLNVSAQAATTGRQIQGLQAESEIIDSQNADLETQLAFLTSAVEMQKRAKEMGFVAVEPDKQTYLVIPGYIGRQPIELAPVPGPDMVAAPLIRPTYTQSLWEWLFHGFFNLTNGTSTAQP